MTREERIRELKASIEAAKKRATREANWTEYKNRLEKAHLDARGEKVTSPLVGDATNAAHLNSEKLRKAKHCKTMPELEAMMQTIAEAVTNGTAEAQEQIDALDKQIEEEKHHVALAARNADIKSLKASKKALTALQEERSMMQLVHDGYCKSSWSKYGPENIVAMYESLVEITEPEVESYNQTIKELKEQLQIAREKRQNLISTRYWKWKNFYKLLKEPELYFYKTNEKVIKDPIGDRAYIDFGSKVAGDHTPDKGVLYETIQEYKSGKWDHANVESFDYKEEADNAEL